MNNETLSASTHTTIGVALYNRANELYASLCEIIDNPYSADVTFDYLVKAYYETVQAAREFCGPYTITKPAVIG